MATKKTSTKISSAKKDIKSAAKKIDKAQDKIIDAAEEEIKTRFTKTKDTVEQLWFAGLGVVGQSIDLAYFQYDNVSTEIRGNIAKGQAFVDDLVERGEFVQDRVDDKLEKAKDLMGEKVSVVKSKISKVFDISSNLQALSDKLESTSKKLEKAS